ncbi:MAG: AAA family ATPase [Candidatus Aenigmatarchaeota archaeon]
MKVIALVGMTGSGKSTVADMLVKKGFQFIRFGQITLDIVKERGLEPTEENERPIREKIRKEHGMAAYAILNIPKIDKLLEKGDVIADGLYSWEEYLELKKRYGESFICIAVYASPETRYKRLEIRKYDPKNDKEMRHRPFTQEQAQSRDYSEIGNLHKAGPVAMADFTIKNTGTLGDLQKKVEEVLSKITG